MPKLSPIALVALAAAMPVPALAHHPMGGAVATTAWQGFVSGVAHPVIGLDHLTFLLAAGVLATAVGRRAGMAALAAFLGAGLLGAVLHLGGFGLGPVEAAVALSVLGAGVALLAAPARLPAAAPGWLALSFGVAGLFHGHAYAEAVAGSGPAPVIAYLLTLLAVQAGIGLLAMRVARGLGEARPQRRWAGAAATVVGAVAFGAAVLA
ncbi:HupE/UreJ family protein [Belnapia sp. T18]|uniref:HupE/UreJ family protein n=1 Tax=Belnapia arida TaxID=2804533 RepID=A0ABS1U0Q0_9PROT|nr:HupE/UreJ family protein [Belnapia arida]MBL6078256.1 HupE/UreJ family protein [Belnapia arida]